MSGKDHVDGQLDRQSSALNAAAGPAPVESAPVQTAHLKTPVPRSREQITESQIDARQVGTASMVVQEETGERPTAGRRGGDPAGRSEAKRSERIIWPSYEPPPNSFREAKTEPASAPSERPESARPHSARPGELASEPKQSVGFYSMRPPRHSSVEIPRAPRVPRDLATPDEQTQTVPVVRRTKTSERASTWPPVGRTSTDSTYPETIRTPPPDAEIPSQRPPRRRSTPPPPMQEVPTLGAPPSNAPERDGTLESIPRIYFAPHVRTQANEWARTGSLSLPGCSSPRHSRALQRALLLALLHEPGYHAIPEGLRQRAGWLFCEGWESGATGHPMRELDDLVIVLGLPTDIGSREILSRAIFGALPKRPSSRPPRTGSSTPRR